MQSKSTIDLPRVLWVILCCASVLSFLGTVQYLRSLDSRLSVVQSKLDSMSQNE